MTKDGTASPPPHDEDEVFKESMDNALKKTIYPPPSDVKDSGASKESSQNSTPCPPTSDVEHSSASLDGLSDKAFYPPPTHSSVTTVSQGTSRGTLDEDTPAGFRLPYTALCDLRASMGSARPEGAPISGRLCTHNALV